MLAYLLAALLGAAFVVRTRRDRRRFGNGVLLGLALCCLALGLLGELSRFPLRAAHVVLAVLPTLVGLSVLATAILLVANGVTMVRREGGRLPNLLSGLAGLGIFALLGLLLAAVHLDSRPLRMLAVVLLLLAGYFGFLLLCFVGYALLYSRLIRRRPVDFVVVLGAGLVDGSRVPPLLAARLERGLALYQAQAGRGSAPLLLVSGGKGSDESRSEADAMADYLIGRGLPAERIRREGRSVSTEQNLEFSRALMEAERPGYRCAVVTSSFHVLRAAVITRRAGVRGQVLGAPTAPYYWPSATLREFVAVLVGHPVTNLGVCALLVLLGTSAGWHR
ncbi:YdcF family protein [Kitasatospora sp. NBC_01250]|uniref:YdcF family protein n=1 Tax=unclassified Kitasatospora TaxID=2633591 RepID=UPI002E131CDF|nr:MULTISPECIES: YdcF family protein [unclassified Kitasatospora]WSJ65638.1 YdcF family protein [Kitasatospora sp. NBC_01302]